MITSSDPIGDWTWEITSHIERVRPSRSVELAASVWEVLAAHELAIPAGKACFSVHAVGEMRNARINETGLVFEGRPSAAEDRLTQAVERVEPIADESLVTLRVECPGLWSEPMGIKHRVEKLFAIQVDIWKGQLIVVTLETYSDAWLTMDTREHVQAEVYAENAPRLAAVLQEISELLGVAIEPGDPNRHATPTETGFEDILAEGPAYSDSWGTFEVPARSRHLLAGLDRTGEDYADITEYPVHYCAVVKERTLGYVWASLGDDAAGFEPRTAAGEEAFEVGRGWLRWFRRAHEQGLSGLDALAWLRTLPARPELGSLGTLEEAASLDALEELSGRY
ncbi:hypothetical protein [Streptomyces sp. NPDC058657]|uniref:hypothetical protein n=1 Tax=unclassified Streptomyces TaxID=2593676 RepID=UPI00365AE3F4